MRKEKKGGKVRKIKEKKELFLCFDCLCEQIKTEITLFFFFLLLLGLFLLLLLLLLSGSSNRCSSSGGSGELLRVEDHVLHLLSLLEGVLGADSDGNEVLETVHDGVRDGSKGRITNLETDGGDVGDTLGDDRANISKSHIENLVLIDETVVEDDTGDKTVAEGTDVKLGQKGSLGLTDLLTSADESGGGENLDLTLDDLSTDVKSLKEGGLSGLETSGTSRNNDIVGSDGTSLGGGTNLEGGDELTDLAQVLLGEDETDVAIKVGEKVLTGRVLVDVVTDSLAHHGLLTHEKDGLATEDSTDLLHLVAADVVALNNDDLGVLIKESLELLEVCSLSYNLFLGWHCEI